MKSKNTALITGAAKRIGREICIFLAGKGFNIALHYNNSKQDALNLKEEIKRTGGECEIFPADFNNYSEVESLIQAVLQPFGEISLLINNASIFEEGLFTDTSVKQLDKHFNINFKAPFLLSQMFAKFCDSGHIINMLDTNITRKNSRYFAYNLSKKTLFEFTKMAAYELGPKIRVNAIAPGPILPPVNKDSEYFFTEDTKIPLGFNGDIKYILKAIEYLMENSFVTGECLFVDGGKHLLH